MHRSKDRFRKIWNSRGLAINKKAAEMRLMLPQNELEKQIRDDNFALFFLDTPEDNCCIGSSYVYEREKQPLDWLLFLTL